MSDPKSEVELLMNDAIAFADQLLREHGEFLPYGAAMKANGDIVSVAAHDGTEQPPSQKLIELLKDGFRQSARVLEGLSEPVLRTRISISVSL